MTCTIHLDFFEDSCQMCREEYLEMKKSGEPTPGKEAAYKEFTEERAKKLYEAVLLHYMKSGVGDTEASRRAKVVVRKQCDIRKIPHWTWL